ncbi:coat protein [Yam virus X]|uniref:Coat protein n=1 Tax=Yam virus X TaxID=1503864 RepID=A0A096XMC1_9VIRU|nr:coat protein [Yam virus X]AIB00373.1 coat protein [Yam virus X]
MATPAPKVDLSDPLAAPSNDDLTLQDFKTESNSVATTDQIKAIAAQLIAIGVPSDTIASTFWDVARHCADVGSSAFITLVGTTSTGVKRSTVAGVIRLNCTLRQFCMFYAKIVWNKMLLDDSPPANWQALNYNEAERFAAFDFFTGVTHKAALNPASGLVRQPTPAEILANQTNARVAIFRSRAQSNNLATTATELTQGRITGGQNPIYLEAPEQ